MKHFSHSLSWDLCTLEPPLGNSNVDEWFWQCLETVVIVTTWEKGTTTGIWWVKARDAAKYPVMHRTSPITTTKLFGFKWQQSKVEKPGLVFTLTICTRKTEIQRVQVTWFTVLLPGSVSSRTWGLGLAWDL